MFAGLRARLDRILRMKYRRWKSNQVAKALSLVFRGLFCWGELVGKLDLVSYSCPISALLRPLSDFSAFSFCALIVLVLISWHSGMCLPSPRLKSAIENHLAEKTFSYSRSSIGMFLPATCSIKLFLVSDIVLGGIYPCFAASSSTFLVVETSSTSVSSLR